MLYVITLKEENLRQSDVHGFLGKELFQTDLFDEITHHKCLNNPHNNEQEPEFGSRLVICKTKVQKTDVFTISDFLEKIEPLVKRYKEEWKSAEITAMLLTDGYKQG